MSERSVGDENSMGKSTGLQRSFVLALKSTIIGLLLGFVWVLIYGMILYSLWAYYGEWFTLDLGKALLSSFMNLFFPFMPFQPSGLSRSPASGLFNLTLGRYFSVYDIMLTVLGLVFLFLVYVSQLVPIIKYSSDEAEHTVSWRRGYVVGIKAGIVGLVLQVVFVSVGEMVTFLLLAGASSGGSTSPSGYSPGMILGAIIIITLLLVVILVFAEAATGTAVIKYATSEAEPGGIGWGASLWTAIKASIIGMLWAILFAFIFGILLGMILVAMVGSPSATAFEVGASLSITILFITWILVSLAPTASLIKYLTQEIRKMPGHVEKEVQDPEKRNINDKTDPKALRDSSSPVGSSKPEFFGKKVCGNCTLFLTAPCPRGYSSDIDIWRSQKGCEFFCPRKA